MTDHQFYKQLRLAKAYHMKPVVFAQNILRIERFEFGHDMELHIMQKTFNFVRNYGMTAEQFNKVINDTKTL